MSEIAVHPGFARRPAAAGQSQPDDQATRLRAIVEAAERRSGDPHPPAPTSGRARGLPHDVHPRRRAKVISVSSGKGGVGKTNASVNMSIALAQSGVRTILLDADLGMANADVLCGVTPTRRLEHFIGVSDLAPDGRPRTPQDAAALAERSLRDLAVDAPGGFRLIPGSVGVARMAELSSREQARLIAGLVELDRDADTIVVDTGAGLGREVIAFIETADLALIIATPEPTSIADAYALIKCATRHAARAHGLRASEAGAGPRMALVVNQATSRTEAAAVHARINAVASRFLGITLPMLGWIAQDARVGAAVRARRPVLLDSPGCAASRDLVSLAAATWAFLAPSPETGGPEKSQGGLSGWLSRLVLRGS